MKIFLSNLVPLACILSAAFLAYSGTPNWGWFLVVAVVTAHDLTPLMVGNGSGKNEKNSIKEADTRAA